MFKSIEYKLYLYMILLIAAVVISTYFAIQTKYVYMVLSILLAFFLLHNMRRSYNQFNKNIIFLLNALDNGDYSFNFAETKLSRREKELNQMMNRIKEILSRARKEVIENEKFLSVIMESVSTGIVILNEESVVVQINRTVNRLLGLPVFTHVNQLANIDRSFPDLFRNLEASDTKTIKIANEREEMQLSLRASEIMLQGRRLKIITLNNIGSELDYKEMDSWIRLIRVMTHEIMNSIAPVTSLTDTLLSAFRKDEPYEEDSLMQNTIEALQTINSTAKGLISFVNSYRRFTGIPKPQLNPVSLQSVIERAIVLEAVMFEEKRIPVTLNLPIEPTVRPLDESQIMQVLLNLLKNAVEAISGEGRQIRIELTEEKEKTYLDVCNNGQPIAEDVLPNIFVPFFTTKHSGTGIGLSVSRYIMRLHGGTLTHFTKDGWTVFRMAFYHSGK
ncbi:sensor histidine kinase [Proteiniphilum acetatigenes]|uniref:sensor histidine kinase n=1 Tax=Proteiniphilum acetatigenes TaxID=294710 RepID=UPI000373D638|nr:ATP-binding protein [Proteiniphilum acetatigenes]SFK85160.1 Histidine kinase-, DNA gyrase B-, and HSP90-like ATPase [Porphyromonadaceae bacterium KH3CP3RA]